MIRNYKKNYGFTLVELLIVIALIAILSVAVLATINPIEQANKARDASVQNDAAEMLNAYERYYTSQNGYPWNDAIYGGNTIAQGTVLALRSDDARFGILAGTMNAGVEGIAGGIGTTGALISTTELKSAFEGKSYFTESFAVPANNVDAMYVVNNGSDSNYVCYVPKASANRAKTANLMCLTAIGTTGVHLRSYGQAGCMAVSDWTAANMVPNATSAFLICVPQGTSVNF